MQLWHQLLMGALYIEKPFFLALKRTIIHNRYVKVFFYDEKRREYYFYRERMKRRFDRTHFESS